jgi:hypothetical protein
MPARRRLPYEALWPLTARRSSSDRRRSKDRSTGTRAPAKVRLSRSPLMHGASDPVNESMSHPSVTTRTHPAGREPTWSVVVANLGHRAQRRCHSGASKFSITPIDIIFMCGRSGAPKGRRYQTKKKELREAYPRFHAATRPPPLLATGARWLGPGTWQRMQPCEIRLQCRIAADPQLRADLRRRKLTMWMRDT